MERYVNWILVLLVTICQCSVRATSTNLSDNTQDVFVEEDWLMRRSYRLEDFLWSGSGDGATDVVSSPWLTTTVFRTTTVMATILTTPVYTGGREEPHQTPVWQHPQGTISPTPTFQPSPSTYFFPPVSEPHNSTNKTVGIPDQRYWLLTVLMANTSVTENTVGIEARLASIYKIAFSRQQERHLGLGNATVAKQLLQSRQRRAQETLTVHVHNVSVRGEREAEFLYSVRVAGRPVLAHAAAADMKLVTDLEVAAELGYPVLTKAEPYLKTSQPLNGGVHMSRTRDTWLLVAAAVSAICLLLLLIALVALGLGKRKRHQVLSTNRQQVFEREQDAGVSNLGYENEGPDVQVKGKSRRRPTTSLQQSTAAVGIQDNNQRTSSASSSGSSQASLVRRRPAPGYSVKRIGKQDPVDAEDLERPKPKPRRRQHLQGSSLIKQVHSEVEDNTLDVHLDGSTEDLVDLTRPGHARTSAAVSPNSLLSMPSVKSFPRGANIPEPLARVLEPISVSHLDSEDIIGLSMRPTRFTRHGSVEGEDPGVVGPLVWDLHRSQIMCQQRLNADRLEGEESIDPLGPDTTASNVGRMRRRFNELLDDAFSLFGSRSVSPDESSSPPPPAASSMHRVHSAIVRPVGEPLNLDEVPRPRTSDYKRPATAGVARPRGAWGSKEPSISSAHSTTLPRPLSAGPFHRPQLTLNRDPIVERDVILADSQLEQADPAVPLIAAIKEELRKFDSNKSIRPSLPGSTSTNT